MPTRGLQPPKRDSGGPPSQTSMYGSEQAGLSPPNPQDRRPEWARDPEAPPAGAMVTEEDAQKFKGFRLESIGEAFRLAAAFVEGGVVPKGMSEGGVVAIWQRGFEAGMQPGESLEDLFVVNGRTSMYANKMLKRARQNEAFAPGGEPELSWWIGAEKQDPHWDPLEEWPKLEDWPSHLKAVMTARKVSDPEREVFRSFSVLDARQMGKWMEKPDSVWMKHPKRQLRARALSFLMRDEFDEFTGGFMPAEELADIEPTREERDVTAAGRQAPPNLGRDPALDAKVPDLIQKADGTEA